MVPAAPKPIGNTANTKDNARHPFATRYRRGYPKPDGDGGMGPRQCVTAHIWQYGRRRTRARLLIRTVARSTLAPVPSHMRAQQAPGGGSVAPIEACEHLRVRMARRAGRPDRRDVRVILDQCLGQRGGTALVDAVLTAAEEQRLREGGVRRGGGRLGSKRQ